MTTIPTVPTPRDGTSEHLVDTMQYLTERLDGVPRRRWPGRVRDAHLGYPTVTELSAWHSRLGAAVREQILRGAPVHRRLPRLVRAVPLVVAVLDVVVLLPYCADVFNVDLTAPGETPVGTMAATMLALLGGGVGYVWLALTGLRLKAFRTELGELAWRAIGALTWLMLAVSGVLIGALATLMYLRVTTEFAAQLDAVTAAAAGTLGLIFAVLSGVANLAIVAVHALDGSVAMAELERAGRVLHHYEQLPSGEVLPKIAGS